MNRETSNTWVQDLKQSDPQSHRWSQFLESYGPFVTRILITKGLDPNTVDDVVQNVMIVVVRRLPDFERRRTGAFRSWLRAIAINCLRDHWKSRHNRQSTGTDEFQSIIRDLEDPTSDLTRMWNREHSEHVLGTLLDEVVDEFSSKNIEVFRRLAINEEKVDDVAKDMEMTVNACFIARSRVLRRLRELLHELFGEDHGLLNLRA